MPRARAERSIQQSITSAHIGALVRKRYPAEAYAVLYEVSDGTGFHANRWADAIAFSLWPSRGLELEGFEFKVSRTDWLKELRNPEKAESIARFCDRWWLVVSDEKIVQPGELPPTWGLMVVYFGKDDEQSLRIVSSAAKLEAVPLDRHFIASVCRSAQKQSATKAVIDAAVAAAIKAERDVQASVAKQTRENGRFNYDNLRREVDEFEKASGVKIIGYQAGDIGRAVNAIVNRRVHLSEGVDEAIRCLETQLDGLKQLAGIEALRKPLNQEQPA